MKFLKSLPKDRLQKLILVVIGSLIGVGVAYSFTVAPGWADLSAHGAEHAKLTEQLQKAQNEIKAEVANTELRNQMTEFIANQEQHLVEGDSFSWVVREISLLAERHPVRVTSLNPGTVAASPVNARFEGYSTKLEAEGTYDQLGKFLSDFENLFPTCTIRSLSVVSVDLAKGRCRVNFDVTLLMRPKNGVAKPPEQKADPKKKSAT